MIRETVSRSADYAESFSCHVFDLNQNSLCCAETLTLHKALRETHGELEFFRRKSKGTFYRRITFFNGPHTGLA